MELCFPWPLLRGHPPVDKTWVKNSSSSQGRKKCELGSEHRSSLPVPKGHQSEDMVLQSGATHMNEQDRYLQFMDTTTQPLVSSGFLLGTSLLQPQELLSCRHIRSLFQNVEIHGSYDLGTESRVDKEITVSGFCGAACSVSREGTSDSSVGSRGQYSRYFCLC